jgi:hypothetical protein
MIAGVVAATTMVGTRVWMARAAGVPATTPLFYAGTLEDENGALSGSKSIVIHFFDAVSGGTEVCSPSPSGATQVTAGRFRVPIDGSCVDAVHKNPELWTEVSVDGQTLPRSKVGAVPYALEAGAVQWGNVGGVDGNTAWPGTITAAQVTGKAVITSGSKTYALNALYCGKTDMTYTGSLGGYAVAKGLCEQKCGASAHMCTSEDLVRSLSLGVVVDTGWYSTGIHSADTTGGNDCGGWQQNTSGWQGMLWSSTTNYASYAQCNVPAAVLCCN